MAHYFILTTMISALLIIPPIILVVSLFYKRFSTLVIDHDPHPKNTLILLGMAVLAWALYLSVLEYQSGEGVWYNFEHIFDRPSKWLDPFFSLRERLYRLPAEYLIIPAEYLRQLQGSWDIHLPLRLTYYVITYFIYGGSLILYLFCSWISIGEKGDVDSIWIIIADAYFVCISITSIVIVIAPIIAAAGAFAIIIALALLTCIAVLAFLGESRR